MIDVLATRKMMENQWFGALSRGSSWFDRISFSHTYGNFFRKINRSLSASMSPSGCSQGGTKVFRKIHKRFFGHVATYPGQGQRSTVREIYKKLTKKLSRPETLEIPEKRSHSIVEQSLNVI